MILLLGTIYINSYLNKINYKEKTLLPNEDISRTSNVPSRNSEPRDSSIDSLTNKNIVNILLIGQDKRPGEERARSDSMIIASLNKKSDSIKLISLMRDMYIEIPGYEDNKINASYAFGGMDLLTETVEENFDIGIDGCIEVDFSGFEKIIDKIGGVDIELNEDEAYYLSRSQELNLTTGINSLTGDVALNYARIRYVGNDDYERTERQRKVLVAVFEKLKNSDIKTLLELSDDILPLVTTNLTSSQILSLVTRVIVMDASGIESYRIPADGEFLPDTIGGMSVLVPDLPENRKLLKEYMGY
ncbi:LCP family protein [Sedimentibacter sp. MB35-C1]|uniref:LCP family protein n=1 Tax=Sedimentibacter sp. MB35-C1 TaxID=3070995 RepID=UPI0027E0AA09|nr:LCP family protein [Sedimentibacter sp. MB35-C1]WMJ78069.1 LCP family protein [Sedimentibacter sp. MB35-C1]